MIENPFSPPVFIKGNKKNMPKNVNVISTVPIVFETKKQYVKELVHNQEKIRGINFTPKQEKQFEKSELKKMEPVIARYTTKSNPYMPPQTVFFTDDKIDQDRMREMSRHEFQHQAWEPFDSEKGAKDMKAGQLIPVKVHPNKTMFLSKLKKSR